MPPHAIAVAQTLATFTLSSAASVKTSLRRGFPVGAFSVSAAERTSVNKAPAPHAGVIRIEAVVETPPKFSRGSGRKPVDARSLLDSLKVFMVLRSSLAMVGGRIVEDL